MTMRLGSWPRNCCIIKTLGDNRPFFGVMSAIFLKKKHINIATTNGFLFYNDDDNNDEDDSGDNANDDVYNNVTLLHP